MHAIEEKKFEEMIRGHAELMGCSAGLLKLVDRKYWLCLFIALRKYPRTALWSGWERLSH